MNKELEQFYIKYRARLVNKVKYSAGSKEAAEDVVQESFTRALQYWDSYNPKRCELGTWFGTILNNTLRQYKRDERSMGTYVELDEELGGGYEMSETDSDMVAHLKEEIEKYVGDAKQSLYLYFFKEYKLREIRCVVAMPYKSIAKLIDSFKKEMRYKYGEGV